VATCHTQGLVATIRRGIVVLTIKFEPHGVLQATLFSCSSSISGICFGEQKHSNTMELQFLPSIILKSVLYNILYVVFEVKWTTNSQ
jgi:hypothetical protein